MRREYRNRTLIITKEGFFFIKNEIKKSISGKPHSTGFLEREWRRAAGHNPANREKYPIGANETRIVDGDFRLNQDEIKELLDANGFSYRDDGYVQIDFAI